MTDSAIPRRRKQTQTDRESRGETQQGKLTLTETQKRRLFEVVNGQTADVVCPSLSVFSTDKIRH